MDDLVTRVKRQKEAALREVEDKYDRLIEDANKIQGIRNKAFKNNPPFFPTFPDYPWAVPESPPTSPTTGTSGSWHVNVPAEPSKDIEELYALIDALEDRVAELELDFGETPGTEEKLDALDEYVEEELTSVNTKLDFLRDEVSDLWDEVSGNNEDGEDNVCCGSGDCEDCDDNVDVDGFVEEEDEKLPLLIIEGFVHKDDRTGKFDVFGNQPLVTYVEPKLNQRWVSFALVPIVELEHFNVHVLPPESE